MMVTHIAKNTNYDNHQDRIADVPLISHGTVPISLKVKSFIEECVKLCKPDEVYICDGTLAENEQMLKLLERKGTIEQLSKYENW